MKTILVFVSTLDGKITKWGDPKIESWVSQKDHLYFEKTWNDSKLKIMGSNTFNVDTIKPSLNHLFVIMTGDPSKYKKYEVSGKLKQLF